MSDWSIERAKLSHDVIGTRFITAVGAFTTTLAEPLVKKELLNEEFGALLDQWGDVKTSTEDLVTRCANEMSPARALDREPLCNMEERFRLPLTRVSHAAWLCRYKVDSVQEATKEVIAEVDRLLAAIEKAGLGPESIAEAGELAMSLLDACSELYDCMRQYPDLSLP